MPPAVVPFYLAPVGKPATFFALLVDKTPGKTRDSKPFYTCRFKDRRRSATAMVWADGPFFATCESEWRVGQFFKLHGLFSEHERYGPQIELLKARLVIERDKSEGFNEADFHDRSRFDSAAMFDELRLLAATELRDEAARTLVLELLDTHRERLTELPAHPRAFYPFPGGWLEHTLSVSKSCLFLADRYIAHYPELVPPLNRDLVLAGAILHDLGRAVELTAGSLIEPTVDGHLFGHQLLGRDLIREAARSNSKLNPEWLRLLEHVILAHLARPDWGSVRMPAIPEVLILHHADDLDAKLELYVRCLTRDAAEGPLTEKDAVIGRPLLKERGV